MTFGEAALSPLHDVVAATSAAVFGIISGEKADAMARKRDISKNIVVGTYRPENEAWIAERRFYNLPLPKCGKLAFHESVSGIVLLAEGHRNFAFKARFKDVVDNAWLAGNGYSRAGQASVRPHGTAYALYELYEESTPAKLLGDGAAEVFVSSSRCPCVKIDEAFYSKPYPVTGGRSMPYVFDCLKPYFRKWKSATTFNPVQGDFFQTNYGFDYGLQVARGIVDEAKKEGGLTCVEICAGAGGQALGLDRAGFRHVALVEYEDEYCKVLRENKPEWNVICGDVHDFDGTPYKGVDLFAGGVPCPPFSVASKQLGEDDERDLFPQAIRLIAEIRPRAVMLENVRGFLDPKFDAYRNSILESIRRLGYRADIKLLQASDFGVPQIRPRVVIVGIRNDEVGEFHYPPACRRAAPSVGVALRDLMGANGWRGLDAWVAKADKIAPTIVGGSKKHGGPDLGPTRARRAWMELGVDGLGIANEPPARDFSGNPKLTKEMIARIQGFPSNWNFGSRKTAACRMIGNAFPPPVANAVGRQIRRCLQNEA
jgi:DNA (cytosine-5)-methyltransferase 1